MADIFGWIGAIAFTICTIPQAIQCCKQGHGKGISAAFLWMWLVGEISMLSATFLRFGWVSWLAFNYLGNTAMLFVIMRYKLWPKYE